MRTIKFRGKATPCNEWVYGSYVVMKNDINTITRHAIMNRSDKENHYIKDGKSYHMSLSVVDENTIGQFTGLCDINGKEIYEGDIIKSSHGTIHYIVYDNDLACFKAVVARYNPSNEYSNLSKGWIAHLDEEVIGNIHDNPELIIKRKVI